MQETKASKLRSAMAKGDWTKALSIASKFPRLGPNARCIRRGHEAAQRPAFYRQLGYDPDRLVKDAVQALKDRYGDPGFFSR